MSRPRTPTNVLELKGVGNKNPQRLRERKDEPKETRDIGPVPVGLSKAQKQAWDDLIDCAIPGVLGKADRPALETAAKLMAAMRADEATSADIGSLIRLLGQFGMTPSERSKINLGGKGDKKNPFADD